MIRFKCYYEENRFLFSNISFPFRDINLICIFYFFFKLNYLRNQWRYRRPYSFLEFYVI